MDENKKYIDPQAWQNCQISPESMTDLIQPGMASYAGMTFRDTQTVLVNVFPPKDDDGQWMVMTRTLAPSRLTKKPKENDWENWRNVLVRDNRTNPIKGVGIDRWTGAPAIELQDIHMGVAQFGVGTLYQTEPLKHLMRLIEAGKILIIEHPLMSSAFENLKFVEDAAGNVKVMPLSNKYIDPFIAMLWAISLAMHPEPEEDPRAQEFAERLEIMAEPDLICIGNNIINISSVIKVHRVDGIGVSPHHCRIEIMPAGSSIIQVVDEYFDDEAEKIWAELQSRSKVL